MKARSNARYMMIQYQKTSLAKPCICQHKLLQYHNKLAPKDSIIFLLWRKLLRRSSREVVAEVVGYLVYGDDDAGEGDLDDPSAL